MALIISVLLFFGLFFLSEKCFFDKLFYKKSLPHGYYSVWPYDIEDWQIVAEKFNHDQRNTDLLNLISAGLGDQEAIDLLEKEQKDSVLKIAIIGDSMFFGTGVRSSQTIAYFLEQEVKKIRDVKVYNYSFFGDDFLDNYAKYQLVKKYLKPDLIIFGLVDNDLLFNSFQRYPTKEVIYQELIKTCPNRQLIEGKKDVSSRDMTRLIYHPTFGHETQNYCFLTNLIKNFSKEDTIFFLFACLNHFCDSEGSYNDCLVSDIYYKFHSACKKQLPIVDLCGEEINPVSEKESHYNSLSNLLIAKKLRDFVIEKYPIFQ
jgi:hypothetical protein